MQEGWESDNHESNYATHRHQIRKIDGGEKFACCGFGREFRFSIEVLDGWIRKVYERANFLVLKRRAIAKNFVRENYLYNQEEYFSARNASLSMVLISPSSGTPSS